MADVREIHVDAMAQAYALDVLEPDERVSMEAHLARCGRCSAIVEHAQATAALLALTAERRDPPAGHEGRMLARLATERHTGQSAPPPRRQFVAVVRTPKVQRQAVRSLVPRLAPLAAAAVLVLGLGAWNARLQQELAHQQQVVRVLAEADSRELAPSTAVRDAQGTAFLDQSTNEVLVRVGSLPNLPTDATYQLWFTRPDGLLDSGGTFGVDERGSGLILARAPAGLKAYVGVGITTEPRGGSRTPTGPMAMYWTLPASTQTSNH